MAVRSKDDAERMRAGPQALRQQRHDQLVPVVVQRGAASGGERAHRARDGGSRGGQAREAFPEGQIPPGEVVRGVRFLAGGLSRRLRRRRLEIAVVRRGRAGLRVPRPDGPREDPPRDSRRPRVRDGRKGGALLQIELDLLLRQQVVSTCHLRQARETRTNKCPIVPSMNPLLEFMAKRRSFRTRAN